MSVALSLEGVSVRRGGRTLLHAVSFEVTAGEIVALIGPNGAGKTTALEAAVGLSAHDGEVTAAPLYWLPDEPAPAAELTVAQHLELGRALGGAGHAEAQALRHRLGLDGLSDARCGTLSRGESRRVMLHGALCSGRPLVVMDEPLGTFDPVQLREVAGALREKARGGAAVLLSVHQLADAEKVADRYVMLHEGRALAVGTLAALKRQAGLAAGSLEDVFLALLGAGRAA